MIAFVLAKLSEESSSHKAIFFYILAITAFVYNLIWLSLNMFPCKWKKTINFIREIDFCVSVLAALSFMLASTLSVSSPDKLLKAASVSTTKFNLILTVSIIFFYLVIQAFGYLTMMIYVANIFVKHFQKNKSGGIRTENINSADVEN